MVSVLFCLINSEVQFQLGKFFTDRGLGFGGGAAGDRHHSMAMTQYTVRTDREFITHLVYSIK